MSAPATETQVNTVNAIAALCAKTDGNAVVAMEKIMDVTRSMLENDNLTDEIQAGAFLLAMALAMEANSDDEAFMTILSALLPSLEP